MQDKKTWNDNLEQLKSKLSNMAKVESLNIKLRSENIGIEQENTSLKKLEKQLRQDYLKRAKEIENEAMHKIVKKNKVIEDQRKRSISNNRNNKVMEN